ncbi:MULTISPECIES: hypothetical protein [Bacillaceae]|uniref:hypothetical protein n=1 Tax=Bacillaceae TaxID=186817 RepID=UPI00203D2BBF|nr:hypothetical protein [Caldibacillus thermoamylovorans]MCM3054544.1 hypothetical protein [Caldibacillus thermoamylovorans]
MATTPVLVVFLNRETLLFGDETSSRHHFEPRNAFFWRRDPFSSPFLYGKLHFLATRSILGTTLSRETPFFGEEALFSAPL